MLHRGHTDCPQAAGITQPLCSERCLYTSSAHAFFTQNSFFFLSLERRAKGSFEVSKCPETQQGEHLALNQAQGIPALGQGLHRGIVGRALHVSKRKLQKPLKKKSLQIKSCTEAVKPPLAESPAPCVQKKGA